MTRLAALRSLIAAPRDHVDQGRIGRRVIEAVSDGREKLARPKPKTIAEWFGRHAQRRSA